MPERQTGRLLLASAIVAAPGLAVVAVLALLDFLAPGPASASAVVLLAAGGLMAWRHLAGLAALRRRIDRLATHGEDPKEEAPTVPDLALSLRRLARSAALAVMGVALLVLAGWWLELELLKSLSAHIE